MTLTAFLAPSLLSGLTDVSVSPGSGINGYPLTWDNTLGKWVATPFPSPDYSGLLSFTNSTESTSPTTGGLILSGGLGVAKRINSGGAIACGNPLSTSSQLTVSGGRFGAPIITLSRTEGVQLAFDWSLAGGALSFRNLTQNQVCLEIGAFRYQSDAVDVTVGATPPGGSGLSGINSFLVGSPSASGATNASGGNLIIGSGRGTGNGNPSSISLRTPSQGPSGTSFQSLVERVNISSTSVTVSVSLKATGTINFPSLPTSDAGLSVGDLWRDGNTVKVKT